MALPEHLFLGPGPFIGTWHHYLPQRLGQRVRAAVVGSCRRCSAQTPDVGAASWYYSSGQLWQPRRQLCPACVATLHAGR